MPDGTVTFVLTDIEGSTRLWSEQPEQMGRAVTRHYEIIDAAVTAHDGARPVEQGEGDSAVCVFTRADDAVRAAAAIQLALADELPLIRVRMAVHTADAAVHLEGPTYAGTSIIRCARLRSCAHGGQVLVSDTTAGLVADDLDDLGGLQLVDLGTARLKGLDRPERVWQLQVPGLEMSFPPLLSAEHPPNNLPTSLSTLIGRDAELTALDELLSSNRLVTLAGTGGVGKTRMALQAATNQLDRHPGGTWWVDLSPVTAPALVVERVAAAVHVGPSEDPVATIARQVDSIGSTLIVVDNAEHLVDSVADLSKGLMVGCPELQLLVTSREPLGVAGEAVWRVPSLATPPLGFDDPDTLVDFDATRLFVERARVSLSDLVIDATSARLIASICTRLDGIPLAIELAAARAHSMPLDRLASGLDHAFRLLTGGDRTGTPRQQTLLASIAWSVDLLDEIDDSVLRRLATLAGEFTIEAAEAIAADDELVDRFDVLDSLTHLVDKSLVQFIASTGRYRLLETVRQFGLDRLERRGELSDARGRHASWCVEWAEADRLERLALDPDDLRSMVPDLLAALDWTMDNEADLALRISAGLGSLITNLGPSTCHRLADWYLGLDRAEVSDAHWAAATVAIAGRALFLQRLELFDTIPAALEAADPGDTYTRLYLRAIPLGLQMFTGSFDEALQLCEEVRRAGEQFLSIAFFGTVGMFAAVFGQLELARENLGRMEEILTRHSLPLSLETAGHGFAGAIYMAMLEGRLGAARKLATADPSTGEGAFAAVMWSTLVGVMTGDDVLVADALRWFDRHEAPALHRMTVCQARCAAALRGDDRAVVGDLAHDLWDAIATTRRAINGGSLDIAAIGFLLADQPKMVEDMAVEWAAVIDESETRWPLNEVSLHKVRALLALHEHRDDEALAESRQQLRHAHRCGFALHTIDALIQLTELLTRRGDQIEAAHVAGAIAAVCARTGYVAPPVGNLMDIGAARHGYESGQPDAYHDGTLLDLDQVVEHVLVLD